MEEPVFPKDDMRQGQAAAVVVTTLLASGCASVVHHAPKGRHSATQAIAVTSDPDGARIIVRGTEVGITPTRIVLKRHDAHVVLRLEKDGFEPAEIPLERTVSGAVAGNLAWALLAAHPNGFADNPSTRGERAAMAFAFPLSGMAVDFITGAAYALPSRVDVTLKPLRR